MMKFLKFMQVVLLLVCMMSFAVMPALAKAEQMEFTAGAMFYAPGCLPDEGVYLSGPAKILTNDAGHFKAHYHLQGSGWKSNVKTFLFEKQKGNGATVISFKDNFVIKKGSVSCILSDVKLHFVLNNNKVNGFSVAQ